MQPASLVDLLLFLVAVAVLLAVLARRLRVPPAAAYVLGGMVLALIPGGPSVALDPGLAMTLFLPPLLMSSAFFTVWREFRANLRPILLLAVGCVAFTTLAVGWTMKWLLPELPWAACFTLGAIISPPDAVTAAAILERLRIPRRLVVVLEGESLVNDAAGLVLYKFAVAAALTGTFDAGFAAGSFVVIAAGGILVGYACARIAIWATRRLDHTHLEIAVSFLAAWTSYLAAEAIGVSGVLSTVTCGLIAGWHQHEVFSAQTRMQARAAWAFIVFVLDALVFILIGLSLHGVLARTGGASLLRALPLAACVCAVTIIARFVWVFPGVYLPRLLFPRIRARDPYPRIAYPLAVGWAGMRGVVSLAAALALPEHFPGRDVILFVTFAVILTTVLVQGTTLGPFIQWLRLGEDVAKTVKLSAMARAAVSNAKLALIEIRAADPLDGAIAADLLPGYRINADWNTRAHSGTAADRAERSGRLSLQIDAIAAGRQALLRMHRAAEIDDAALDDMERELDLEEIRVRGQLGGA